MGIDSLRQSLIGLLLALGGGVAIAVCDAGLAWAGANWLLIMLCWLGWQAATLALLVWSIPPLFSRWQSNFLRRSMIVVAVLFLHSIASLLGVTLIANAREALGLSI